MQACLAMPVSYQVIQENDEAMTWYDVPNGLEEIFQTLQ